MRRSASLPLSTHVAQPAVVPAIVTRELSARAADGVAPISAAARARTKPRWQGAESTRRLCGFSRTLAHLSGRALLADSTGLVVDEIAAAHRSILVQASSFTSVPILAALKAAHARGVDVEVIVDKTSARARAAVGPVTEGINL
jgi:phosphatidylserine/phosphatidylglycerophosphate/cardiolipin synthase-like enzyme